MMTETMISILRTTVCHIYPTFSKDFFINQFTIAVYCASFACEGRLSSAVVETVRISKFLNMEKEKALGGVWENTHSIIHELKQVGIGVSKWEINKIK